MTAEPTLTGTGTGTPSPTATLSPGASPSITPTPSSIPPALVYVGFTISRGSATVMQNLTASTPLRCAIASIGGVPLSRVALAGTYDYASRSVVKYNSSSEANIIDICNVWQYIQKKSSRRYLAYVQETGKTPSNELIQQWHHEINSGQYNSRGVFPRGKQIVWPSQPSKLFDPTMSSSNSASGQFIESAVDQLEKKGAFAENEIQRQNAISGLPVNKTFAREWVKRMLQTLDKEADLLGLNITSIRHGNIWIERKPIRSNSVGYATSSKTDGFDVSTSIEVPPNPTVADISNGDDNGRAIPLINAQLNASMQLVSKFNISDDLLVSELSTFIYALASISGINASLLMSEFTIIRPLEIVLPSLRPPSSTNSAPPAPPTLTQPEQISVGVAVPVIALILGAVAWETMRRRHRASQQAVKELVLKSRRINSQTSENVLDDTPDNNVSHTYELTSSMAAKLNSGSRKSKDIPIEVDARKKKKKKKKSSIIIDNDTPGLFKRTPKVSTIPDQSLSTASVLVTDQSSNTQFNNTTNASEHSLQENETNRDIMNEPEILEDDEYSIDGDEDENEDKSAVKIADEAEANLTQTFRRSSHAKPALTSTDFITVKGSQEPSPTIEAPVSPTAFSLKRISSSSSTWFDPTRSPRVAPEPVELPTRSATEPTEPMLPVPFQPQPQADLVTDKQQRRTVPEPVEPKDTIQGAASVLEGHLQLDSETALLPTAARISLQTKSNFPMASSRSTSTSASTAGSTVQAASLVDDKDAPLFIPPPLFRRTNLNLVVGNTNIQTTKTSTAMRAGPMGIIQKVQGSGESPLPLRRQIVLGKALPPVRPSVQGRNPVASVLLKSDSLVATPAEAWSPVRHFGYISRDSSTEGTPAREANAFFQSGVPGGANEIGRRRSVAGFSPSSPGNVQQTTSPTMSRPPLYKHLHQPIVFARASANADDSDDDEEVEDEITAPSSAPVSAQPSPATFTRQRDLRPVTMLSTASNPSPRTQTLEKYAYESLELAAGGVNQVGTFLGFNPNPLMKRGGKINNLPESAEEIAGKAEKRVIAMASYKSLAVVQLQQRRPTFKRSQNQEKEEDEDGDDDDEDNEEGEFDDRYSRASTEELEEEDLTTSSLP